MKEFIPINTQEEFEDRIKDRLRRERDKYAGYDEAKAQLAAANAKIADLETAIATKDASYNTLLAESQEKDTKIAGYEVDAMRTAVVVNKGLPMNLRSYLKGTTEEELNASANELIAAGAGGNGVTLIEHDDSFFGEPDEDRAMNKFIKSLEILIEPQKTTLEI